MHSVPAGQAHIKKTDDIPTASQQLVDSLILNLSRTSLGGIRLCPFGFDAVRASQFDCTEVLNIISHPVPAEVTTTGVTLTGKSFAISCSCRLPRRLHTRSFLLYPVPRLQQVFVEVVGVNVTLASVVLLQLTQCYRKILPRTTFYKNTKGLTRQNNSWHWFFSPSQTVTGEQLQQHSGRAMRKSFAYLAWGSESHALCLSMLYSFDTATLKTLGISECPFINNSLPASVSTWVIERQRTQQNEYQDRKH